MPLPPTVSPSTGQPVPPYYLHASSAHFRDTYGRHVLLRGVNLSSSAKTPVGQPGSQLDGFWENAKAGTMSFVGRVLDLENGKADEHLARLRNWGFNCLRYVVTWESIEHAGPGQYDQDYINYTIALLRKCKEHGFLVYMDPHQDLFSRFAGGSGAPYWTLLACGLDPEHFTATNAACIECEWPTPSAPSPADFPAMIWASNYSRLACQTLFTLWAAGRDYAPKCVIDGVNIQDWLEAHYFRAMGQLGQAIFDAGGLVEECVIGWDSLNEPNHGFLGTSDVRVHAKESILRIGPMPTALEGMRLGMGTAVDVERWKFSAVGPKRDGKVLIDPRGKRAWLQPEREKEAAAQYGWTRSEEWTVGTCIWALHGVWDVATEQVLQPDYFDLYRGDSDGKKEAETRKVDFGADYWLPHWKRWASVVRAFHPEAILFIQSPVFQIPPKIEGPEVGNRAVHSSHFYDGLTLVTKHWNWFNADALGILRGKYPSVLFGLKIGESAIRNCLQSQLSVLRSDTLTSLGAFPTMMGEIGIPFDLDRKQAYTTGNYSAQVRALDASLNACDGTNVLSYSLWTYCADNGHAEGDRWNGEDLSIWSADDALRIGGERRKRAESAASSMMNMNSSKKSRSRANSRTSLWTAATGRSRASSSSSSSSLYPTTSGTSQRGTPTLSSARLSTLGAGSSSIGLLTPLQETTSSHSPSSFSSTSFSSLATSSTSVLLLVAPVARLPIPTSINDALAPPPPSSPSFFGASSITLASSAATTRDPFTSLNLNDGARALAAFCRPFPVKTVGELVRLDFDVRSAVFKATVKVCAGDVREGEGESGEGEGRETVIYLPEVHFARDAGKVSRLARDDCIAPGGGGGGGTPSPPASTLVVLDEEEGERSAVSGDEEEGLLAIDVEVSCGRWNVEGQYLRWWYDVPGLKDEEQEKELWIVVKRRGGAIPSWAHAYDECPATGVKAVVAAAKELLCPPDLMCTVC